MKKTLKERLCKVKPLDITVILTVIGVIILFIILDVIYRSNIDKSGMFCLLLVADVKMHYLSYL